MTSFLAIVIFVQILLTSADNSCQDKMFPAIPCATLTQEQCNDPIWKPTLVIECPSTCGLCDQVPCRDKVSTCTLDMCNQPANMDYLKENCMKTCNLCGSYIDPCFQYKPDKSTSCKTWKEQGFCTSTFYTLAQKKEYCSTTCKIC